MSAAAKKYGALGTFVLQNAGVVLLMRYTKVYPGTHVAYSSTAAVLMTEVTKMPLCFVLETYQRGGPCSFLSGVKHDLATNGLEWLKLCLPALLYTIQNNCLFIGLANLEAAIAQVTYQLKIFFTALFSIWLLGKRLHCHQWIALALLAAGVLCVQGLPAKLANGTLGKAGSAQQHAQTADEIAAARQTLIGIGAMLIACLCSSFAGVRPPRARIPFSSRAHRKRVVAADSRSDASRVCACARAAGVL